MEQDKPEEQTNTEKDSNSKKIYAIFLKVLLILGALLPVYMVSIFLTIVELFINKHDVIQFVVYNYMITTVSYTATVTCYLSKNKENNKKYTYARNILLVLSLAYSFVLFFNIHNSFTSPIHWLEILLSIICFILLFIIGWYLVDEVGQKKKSRKKRKQIQKEDKEDKEHQEKIIADAKEATSFDDGNKKLDLGGEK